MLLIALFTSRLVEQDQGRHSSGGYLPGLPWDPLARYINNNRRTRQGAGLDIFERLVTGSARHITVSIFSNLHLPRSFPDGVGVRIGI